MKEWWVVSFSGFDGDVLSNMAYTSQAEAAKSYDQWIEMLHESNAGDGSTAAATITITHKTETQVARYEYQPKLLTDA